MNLNTYVEGWERAMRNGEIGSRAFSPLTVEGYLMHIRRFLSNHDELTYETVRAALREIQPEQYGKHSKLYKAVICFVKFLHAEGVPIDKRLLVRKGKTPDKLEALKRRRMREPKQTTVTQQDLEWVKSACENPFERLVITLLSTSGLRASEACALRLSDLSLTEAVLAVREGKGRKSRRVALMKSTVEAIQDYLSTRPQTQEDDLLLVPPAGGVFDRFALGRLLRRIGRRVEVEVTPHSLRRAFVTISHAKGAPLDYIRLSAGHSDIKVTMGYLKTQEAEVLEYMKRLEM